MKRIARNFVEKECDLGYIARSIVQTSLPYANPNTNEFIRSNGDFTLTMLAPSEVGLPYGSIPRIILVWITSEAVKTKNKKIYLGENLSSFLKNLGFDRRGGERGDITRVKAQLKKIFQTHIILQYKKGEEEKIKNIQAINQAHSFWSVNSEKKKWQTELILSQEFFEEIIEKPIPINLKILKAIRNSSLAIDIYFWLTYRIFYLKRETFIPWEKLFFQFGTGYAHNSSGKFSFRKKFVNKLEQISLFYISLNINIIKEGIILKI